MVTLGGVALFYLAAGVSAGAIVGLLRPLARSRVGAALVGLIACAPVSLGGIQLVMGLQPWTGRHTFVFVAYTLPVGILGGLIVHGIFSED